MSKVCQRIIGTLSQMYILRLEAHTYHTYSLLLLHIISFHINACLLHHVFDQHLHRNFMQLGRCGSSHPKRAKVGAVVVNWVVVSTSMQMCGIDDLHNECVIMRRKRIEQTTITQNVASTDSAGTREAVFVTQNLSQFYELTRLCSAPCACDWITRVLHTRGDGDPPLVSQCGLK